MSDVKQRVLPGTPQSPYVVLPAAAVQSVAVDDYATPPPSPVSDKKSEPPADGKLVSSGTAAVYDKCVASCTPPKGISKPVGLPLSVLNLLCDCVLNAPISDGSKRGFFVSLIEGAQLAFNSRLEAGMLALHSGANGFDGLSSAGSAAAAVGSRRSDRHGGKYSILNDDTAYLNVNGITTAYGTTNGPWGYRANGTGAASAPSITSILLNAPFFGDQWGELDPGAVAFRMRRARLELTLYPRNAVLTKSPPTTSGSSTWDPLNLSKQTCRILVVRDKWGLLANGTGSTTSALCSTATNVVTSPPAPPTDFTSLFATSQDPSGSFGVPANPGMPSINRMHFNALTEAYRYDILHDEVVECCHMQSWTASDSTPRWGFTGLKRVSIDLKLDSISLAPAVPTAGNQAVPQTNALYLVLVSSLNSNTYTALDIALNPVSSWLPQIVCDLDYRYTFQPILPVSSAP